MIGSSRSLFFVVLALALNGAVPALAQEVNVYSARHYDTDDLLYDSFREETGIRVNVIEGNGPELLARLKAEGANSPADIFLTVDAGNLWSAEQDGIFQPVQSAVLEERVPASLRSPDGLWFGFSTRARMIFVNEDLVDPKDVPTYESLADPKLKGKVCMRASSAIYNLSLMGALIEHWGSEKAEEWAKGVVANFAIQPQRNDTAVLRSVAARECGVAISNHYYYLRMLESAQDQEAAESLTPIAPDQDGRGTHVNISGAGVLIHAPHKEEAVRFLEYMVGDAAQAIYAGANYEFPVVKEAEHVAALERFEDFKIDPVNVSVYGANQAEAQMIYDRAGWR